MYYFTTRRHDYKSYQSKWFDISLSSNGSDPSTVVVKVLKAKKPTAEIKVYVGSFSESRGVGFSSAKFIRTNDSELVAICRGCIADDTGIVPLIDMLNEKSEQLAYAKDHLLSLINRWWVLAQQQHPSQFIDDENRSKA